MEAKIYERTNGGLDIIRRYFPDVNERDKFKLRPDERTPSAKLWKKDGVYLIKDFGSNDPAITPIRLIMQQTGCTYWEAVNREADLLGLTANKVYTTPKISKVATTDADSTTHVESSDFTEKDLRFWGVPKEVLTKYGWQVCVSYTTVKNGSKVTVESTDGYRMYVRNCGDFYKVYKPQDSYARFMIIGEKPELYLHGEKELIDAFKKNDSERLDLCVLCSGERDAMVAAANGHLPVWKNSETEKLTVKQYNTLKNYVKDIYNIPDIDETGIKCAKQLALQYIDMYTVYIPSELRSYSNNGKPRKDLRDWYDFHNKKSDFEILLNSAKKAKYYYVEDEDNKIHTSKTYFYYLLYLLNVYRIDINGTETSVILDNGIIKPIQKSGIKRIVFAFLDSKKASVRIKDLTHSLFKNANIVEDLELLEVNNQYYDENLQVFCFENTKIRVTADDICSIHTNDIHFYENQVLPYTFYKLQPSFTADDKNITIHNTNSHFFRFLINSSRLYWREELEDRADEAYLKNHKFSIDGPLLTESEIEEQKQCLLNKIYFIGYMLHRFKDSERPMAPWIMENNVMLSSKANGGSGKSFIFRCLKKLLNIVEIDARSINDIEDKFQFDGVTAQTNVVLFSDTLKEFDVRGLYNKITDGFTVKVKNKNNIFLSFNESPKIAITSNYAPNITNNDSSSHRRFLFVTMSDYYHYKVDDEDDTMGIKPYKETRTIGSDFGYKILDHGYKDEYYNEDFNFMLECLQYYLQMCKKGVLKIEPKLNNVMKRIQVQQIGDTFYTWAKEYFAREEIYNHHICRGYIKETYTEDTGLTFKSTQEFTKRIESYCKYNSIEINPIDIVGLDKNGKKNTEHKETYINKYNEIKTDRTFYFRKK